MTQKTEDLDAKILAKLQANVEAAQKRLASYLSACPTCRMLSDSLIRETVGTFMIQDSGMIIRRIDKYDSAAYCPTCNSCMWSSES